MRRGFGARVCHWRREKHAGGFDFVDLGKVLGDVGVALVGDEVLAGLFTIAGVNLVYHVYPIDDFSEGRKTHSIEPYIVPKVDEQLGGTRVGASGRKDEPAAGVALLDRIVLDRGLVPGLVHGRVGVEAKLDHKPRNNAEETRVGKEAAPNQIVKAVSAQGRPITMDFHYKIAGRGGKSSLEISGGLGGERGRVEQ